ncbi:MAG: hypothetical protein JJU00_19960 [Opitutales bacterium]|nr:hypothetical protein [Opitutales bacterium]
MILRSPKSFPRSVLIPGSYSEEAEAVFSVMTTQPDATRKGLIDDVVTGLQAAGLWPKMHRLWVWAAHDSQAALIDWITATVDLTPVGSLLPFEADKGFYGNGSDYFDSEMETGPTFSYDSPFAGIGCWLLVGISGADWVPIGDHYNWLIFRPPGSGLTGGNILRSGARLNGGAGHPGCYFLQRVGNFNQEIWLNGALANSTGANIPGAPW